jgi:hypothetical protein
VVFCLVDEWSRRVLRQQAPVSSEVDRCHVLVLEYLVEDGLGEMRLGEMQCLFVKGSRTSSVQYGKITSSATLEGNLG